MKLIAALLIFFLANSLSVSGQSMIGYTEKEIRKELSDKNFKNGIADDGIRFISYSTDEYEWVYYFDKTGHSYFTMLLPLNKRGYLDFIKEFNKRYIIVSDTEWKIYSKGQVTKVNLQYGKERDVYFFIYY